jgi:hypothetical protein
VFLLDGSGQPVRRPRGRRELVIAEPQRPVREGLDPGDDQLRPVEPKRVPADEHQHRDGDDGQRPRDIDPGPSSPEAEPIATVPDRLPTVPSVPSGPISRPTPKVLPSPDRPGQRSSGAPARPRGTAAAPGATARPRPYRPSSSASVGLARSASETIGSATGHGTARSGSSQARARFGTSGRHSAPTS